MHIKMASVAPKPNKALLYIANDLGGTQKHQNIKYGKNGIIYNSALVQKLTDMFSIDYTDRTSVTFSMQSAVL